MRNNIFDVLNAIETLARKADWQENRNGNVYRPACSVDANDEVFSMYIDLPGVAKEDIDVELEQGVLTLKAVRKVPAEEKYEFRYGVRTDKYDPDQVKLSYENGMLTVTVPARATAKPQKLTIA